jgi:hypothetical protein
LERLLAAGVRPDLLYVEVVPFMLAAHQDQLFEERMLDGARLNAAEVWRLRRLYHQPSRLLSTWCLGRLLPCYRHQAEIRTRLAPGLPHTGLVTNDNGFDDHGWRPQLGRISEERRRTGTALAQELCADRCAVPDFAREPVEALEALLGRCRGEHIPVALVLMPEGEPFRAFYSPAARTALADLLGRIQRTWGVCVVDARTWVAEEDFCDTHHLLADGGRHFTARFGREVLRPVVATLAQGTQWVSRNEKGGR